MGHEDHVCGRAGADRGEGPSGTGRQEVGHRRGPFGQIRMTPSAQALDAAAPPERSPVPAFGEEEESVPVAEACGQPPDLLCLLPAAEPGAVRAAAEERVRHPVGHDVQARVELDCRLHDDPGTPLADREQVVDKQQRVAGASVTAEHDEGALIGQGLVRRRCHLDPEPAGADRHAVDQVEKPRHDRVVAGPVGLGIKPPAEAAHDPQAEQNGERGGLADGPGESQEHHPQQPGPVTVPGQPSDQCGGRAEQGDWRCQDDQASRDHDDERRQRKATDQPRGKHRRLLVDRSAASGLLGQITR